MKTYVEYLPFKLLFRGLKFLGLPSMHWYYELYHNAQQRKIKQLIPESIKILREQNNLKIIRSDAPIFFMWWQGFDNMPEVVKLCYSQLYKCAGSHPIVFLCENNFRDIYLSMVKKELESNVVELFYSDHLKVQHLSDILRNKLLYNCGGIWIDATVFLTKNIDIILNDSKFFSGRRDPQKANNYFPSRGRWTSYFVASDAWCSLTKFLYSGLEEILERNGSLPDYFTLDYLFSIAYEEKKEIRDMIGNIPTIEPIIGHFNNVSGVISQKEYNDIICKAPFFKLDWRKYNGDYDESGKPTIFYYLKQYCNSL